MDNSTPPITPELVAEYGLKSGEYNSIISLLGRTPTLTELAIFSAMWNEHCSYKSSKKWLRTLPTQAPHIIQGPGENAGVVDIGDGEAIIFKMESHNHPSFIAPYQGAATGVGGILRDIFTMGARPIAVLNMLRFGHPNHPITRHLLADVVRGIGDYGNAFGVPTIGGDTDFDEGYNGNILVNAMAIGYAESNKIFYSKANCANIPIVYLGAKTGRDGIHGASMASAEFTNEKKEHEPNIQIGDPFAGKRLLEACLELMKNNAVIAIQDMGAAGLTCSAVEIGAKSNLGIELNLSAIPCRELSMTAHEIMLSESQERMLMVLRPDKEDEAKAIFKKWELEFVVVGQTIAEQRFIVRYQKKVKANLPIKELSNKAPEYDQLWSLPDLPDAIFTLPPSPDHASALSSLLSSPNMCSRRWIWEQYDYLVMGNTVQPPGGNAAVIKLEGSLKGIAACINVTPRYCKADPLEGGKQAVAEVWRNLTSVGADPLAVTDSLNFGNPERPQIMSEFVQCIKGIGEACRALDFPVVSGNVSLYNETLRKEIPPTPAIGGIGLLPDARISATLALKAETDVILLIGKKGEHLGQSIYLRNIHNQNQGLPPRVNLTLERKNGDFIRHLIRSDLLTAVHDISDGGLIIALAEMAMAGGYGATIALPADIESVPGFLFGEDQARYVVTCKTENLFQIVQKAKAANILLTKLGTVEGTTLNVLDTLTISVAELKKGHEKWFYSYMGENQELPDNLDISQENA